MSEVIAIANQKGGVGKTMTSVSLSACLALNNKKVLLLDLDPQGHSTKAFGFYDSTQYPLSMKDVIVSVIEDIPLDREQLILHSNENVDIVIRPEDIDIVKKDEGFFNGIVISEIFKGVHYEIHVQTENRDFLIHTTDYHGVNEEVGLIFTPDDIHIMEKMEW